MPYIQQFHASPLVIQNQTICFEPHVHEDIEIIILFDGVSSLSVDGVDYRMNSGDGLIVFPNLIHSFTSDSAVDVGKFIFPPQLLPALEGIFRERRPLSPIISAEHLSKAGLITLSREILTTYRSSSSPVQQAYLFLLTGKLLELLDLEERHKNDSDLVQQICQYCRKNFRSSLTQGDVANALHISQSHLSHIFGSKLKINFRRYINMLRVNESYSLLQDSKRGILEIAEESGFSSLRSFNRAFSMHTGMSPKEYREMIKRGPGSGVH